MSFENPQNLISSWNLQTSFATGPVLADQLVPKKFARISTPFVCCWREEKLNSILDHGSQNFSIYLPESLRVLKECYLKIEVPQTDSALKPFPGIHFIKQIRLLSAGQEVYVADYHGLSLHFATREVWEDVLPANSLNGDDPASRQ